jgi:hypothetical protein
MRRSALCGTAGWDRLRWAVFAITRCKPRNPLIPGRDPNSIQALAGHFNLSLFLYCLSFITV